MSDEKKRPGRKPGGKNKVKNASKIIKNHQEKMFNKNHQDELSKAKGERIKNDIEDGENFTGI